MEHPVNPATAALGAGNEDADGPRAAREGDPPAAQPQAPVVGNPTRCHRPISPVANDGAAGEGDNATADVENVTRGSAADNLTGSSLRNQFSGGPGRDVLVGGSEPEPSSSFGPQVCNRFIGGPTGIVLSVCGDTLSGDGDNDNLFGQGQDDLLVGGLGVDRFDGGDGDDIVNSREGVLDTRINCGPGSDTAVVDLRDEDGSIVDSNCETVR